MLTSLAFIFILGFLLSRIAQILRLPKLIGMLIAGMLLGPYGLGLLDNTILQISPQLRQFALVIILTRAGLALNLGDLKKVGRPAMLMCFLPAVFEICATILIAPLIFNISYLDAAIIGSVIAAVSPAVIVPRMINLIEQGYGIHHGIPQLIMAGAAADDVFVIVLFSSFTAIALGGSFSPFSLGAVPVSIMAGIIFGALTGTAFVWMMKKISVRNSEKVILLLSVSFMLLFVEEKISTALPFSALIAIMALGTMIYHKDKALAAGLSQKYNKLWIGAELLLFVLVGATVDISYAVSEGWKAIVLVASVLLFRMAGVWCCLLKTRLEKREKVFCMIAYLPKATVQAAIGGIPLTMGLPQGKLVLTVAVVSILLTAPIGALLIDKNYKRLLVKTEPDNLK